MIADTAVLIGCCDCRYSSAGRSLLEPMMQHYWEWLVGRVPAWIAPNLITVVGLATNVFTTLVLVYYCPTATEQVGLQEDSLLTIKTFKNPAKNCSCHLLNNINSMAVWPQSFGWLVSNCGPWIGKHFKIIKLATTSAHKYSKTAHAYFSS